MQCWCPWSIFSWGTGFIGRVSSAAARGAHSARRASPPSFSLRKAWAWSLNRSRLVFLSTPTARTDNMDQLINQILSDSEVHSITTPWYLLFFCKKIIYNLFFFGCRYRGRKFLDAYKYGREIWIHSFVVCHKQVTVLLCVKILRETFSFYDNDEH